MGAAEVAAVLAPLLVPFAKQAASEAQRQIATRLGGEAAQSLARLWGRVHDHFRDVDEQLADEAIESQLTEALERDPRLLEEARTTVSIVVQGNQNTVQQGGTNINISGGRDIRIGRLSD